MREGGGEGDEGVAKEGERKRVKARGRKRKRGELREENGGRSKSGWITDYFALRHPRFLILSHLKLQ